MSPTTSAPVGGLLYSLLHLGGFSGDLRFYAARSSGRVLELGAGDGRIAAALCVEGAAPLSILQQQQCDPVAEPTPLTSPLQSYTGIELCEPLADKARTRLAQTAIASEVVVGDFLVPPPDARLSCFDTVILSANTLFSNGAHDALLANCAASLTPGGTLLLDVYNALPWHGSEEDEATEEEEAEEEDESTLLVRVDDEDGRQWSVHEREPLVDSAAQRITQAYEFVQGEGSGAPTAFCETLVHEYLLPEQLVRKLDASGFAIEEIFGGFGETPFDPEESEHVVVVARRRGEGDEGGESA